MSYLSAVDWCLVLYRAVAVPDHAKGERAARQFRHSQRAYNTCYTHPLTIRGPFRYPFRVLTPKELEAIRGALGVTQEEMARLLGVSFASVNRWEGGHSSPLEGIQDLYQAVSAALKAGASPNAIRRAASDERGAFLYTLFRLAYGPKRRARR